MGPNLRDHVGPHRPVPVHLLFDIRSIDKADEPKDDPDQQHVDEGLRSPRPGSHLALALSALIDEISIDDGQILSALSKPTLGLRQRHAHQQRVVFRTVGGSLPGSASRFEPCFPGEKLALRGNPIAQLAPSPEDRLVRHLGVCLLSLGCCRDEQAVGMIGKLGHQPPFLVCELRAEGAPARRLLALAHGGKLQGENAAELIFRVRMGGSECVGAIDQHVPKLEGLSGKTQNSVAPLNHVLPHVVECVRQ